MSGEKNLQQMLKFMTPDLIEGEYVFCTIKHASYGAFSEFEPIASFCESEGLTLVLLKENADRAGLSYEGVFHCITLGVHSSLEAVGLTAAVSTALADDGISANMIAGYFHDHIFIPQEHENRALGILLALGK